MLIRIQGNVPSSSLGIDYFDADGNEIDEYVRELIPNNSNPFTGAPRFQLALPPGAVRATFWV